MKLWLRRWLTHSRWPFIAGAISIVLTLPSIPTGLAADDWVHRAMLLRLPGFETPPLDIFAFITADPERAEAARRLAFPWWTAPDLKLAFWRPLAAATHWFDYALWPNTPSLMHVHSVLWHAASVVLAGLLFRRLLSDRLQAGIATLAYAVSHTHAMPVLFLANRNALVGLFFGIATLLLHDRWRRSSDRRAAALAPFALLFGLLSNEGTVAACAYLFAYALFLDERPLRSKVASLLPYAATVTAWRIVYQGLGYGASGSNAYIDPVASPQRFLEAVATRGPIYLLAEWFIPPSDWSQIAPPDVIVKWAAAAIVFLGVLSIVFLPLLRRDRVARFWFAGMLLSIVPSCATFPMDRMLLYSGLGAAGLLAQFAVAVHRSEIGRTRLQRTAIRIVFDVLVALHLIISPIWLPLRIVVTAKELTGMTQGVERLAEDPSLSGKLVVLIDDAMWTGAYLSPLRAVHGLPQPEQLLILAPVQTRFDTIVLSRPSEDTLVMNVDGSYEWFLERDRSQPFTAGDVIEVDRVTVKVLEVTRAGHPTKVAFQFDTSLDDESIAWFARLEPMTHAFATKGYYPPWHPPAVGAAVGVR